MAYPRLELICCISRRGLMTNTITSTNTSHKIIKVCVLKRALDMTKIEKCHCDKLGQLQITGTSMYLARNDK